jgi:alkylation response protein AidB-like acyl-CoA dehydrogenase
MTYTAPLADMRFALRDIAGLGSVASLPGYEHATDDTVDAVLEEAAKLAGNGLAPLNRDGDKVGAKLENGVVRTAPGFVGIYREFVEGGWNSLPFDPEFGGQGMPWLLAATVQEMWQAANMGFGLVLLLNQGAIDAVHHHASVEQKATWLPKMISGEWTGTMNLTEPQAGSDLGQLKSRAVRSGDHYLITGQKIFITYGEHDMAENIVHLVLARTPDAPAGVRGISLFIVPKFLVGADGKLGKRNDLCVSLEHKLGIHASPTCVMSFGDDGGAVGYLVGEEGRGLSYMFTMMNNARLSVGIQGLAIAERAYQQAAAFARTRVQSKDDGSPKPEPVAIVHHADVRRMLMTMRAQIEAMRALGYYTAAGIDGALRHPDKETARKTQDRVDLLIPIVKAWFTDLGNEIASVGVQIHGGMGFIEETGAAQHLRDARILPIYEGTNGIQARDRYRKVTRRRRDHAGPGGRNALARGRTQQGAGRRSSGDLGRCRRRGGRAGGRHGLDGAIRQGRPGHGPGGLGPLPAAGRHRVGWVAAGQERAGGARQAGKPRRRSRLPGGQDRDGALLCRGDPAAGACPARAAQGRRPHGVRAAGGSF